MSKSTKPIKYRKSIMSTMIKCRRFIEKVPVSRFHLSGLWHSLFCYCMSVTGKRGVGIPLILLHDAEGGIFIRYSIYIKCSIGHFTLCFNYLFFLFFYASSLSTPPPSLYNTKSSLLSRRDNSRVEGRTCLSRHFRRGARLDELHT